MNRRQFIKKSLEGIVVAGSIPLISGCSKNPVESEPELNFYYYYYDEKIQLNLSKDKITVKFNEDVYTETKNNIIQQDSALDKILEAPTLPYGLQLVKVKEGIKESEVLAAINRMNGFDEIRYSIPVFLPPQQPHLELVLFDEFITRFHLDVTKEQIKALNLKNDVAIVSESPSRHNRFLLRVLNPKSISSLDMANSYHENDLTQYAGPNFMSLGGWPLNKNKNEQKRIYKENFRRDCYSWQYMLHPVDF